MCFSNVKRFYALLVFVPITAGIMMLWPVDEVFTADTTDLPPRPAAATVSSAVASASSAIATASSAIATASSAIATASSAIATASSAIATDPSAAAVDAIACDDDTAADLCDTTTTTTTAAAAASAVTSGVTSTIADDDNDDCTTDTAAPMTLGHVAGATGRGLDIVGPRRRSDGLFDRVVVRPRTVGLKMIEKIVLIALSMFFQKLELAVYISLYKLKLLYSTLIAPVLDI